MPRTSSGFSKETGEKTLTYRRSYMDCRESYKREKRILNQGRRKRGMQ